MRLLTTNSDIRKFRQLGKQVNDDNFDARVLEVQTNELTELLNRALSYDFFDFLDNGFTLQAGTFTRDSDYIFTAAGADLSGLAGNSLRINDTTNNTEVFVIVSTAVFGGVDTIITVTGYILPQLISTVEFSTETKYINLLNGESYTKDNETIQYFGLRGFISWKFLAIFLSDANVKHSDTGNFAITSPNFQRPSNADKVSARSTYLQNSVRSENDIISYLNEKSSDFTLWDSKGTENIESYNIIVI
jgi:hypothetical protein